MKLRVCQYVSTRVCLSVCARMYVYVRACASGCVVYVIVSASVSTSTAVWLLSFQINRAPLPSSHPPPASPIHTLPSPSGRRGTETLRAGRFWPTQCHGVIHSRITALNIWGRKEPEERRKSLVGGRISRAFSTRKINRCKEVGGNICLLL